MKIHEVTQDEQAKSHGKTLPSCRPLVQSNPSSEGRENLHAVAIRNSAHGEDVSAAAREEDGQFWSPLSSNIETSEEGDPHGQVKIGGKSNVVINGTHNTFCCCHHYEIQRQDDLLLSI